MYYSPKILSIAGFSSTEEGNILTDEDQWKKMTLIKEIAEEVWG